MSKLLEHLCLSTHALCSPSSPTELRIGAYRVAIDAKRPARWPRAGKHMCAGSPCVSREAGEKLQDGWGAIEGGLDILGPWHQRLTP